MSAIRNTYKSLSERLLLNQERTNEKSLAERLSLNQESTTAKPLVERLKPAPYTNDPILKCLEMGPHTFQVGVYTFTTCPPDLYFCKTKKLLHIKEYKELLEPTLDHISLFFTKMSENKSWAENPQYDSLWKWFNRLQGVIIELDKIGHKLTAKEWRVLKGACKHLKNVDFSKPATRVPEICTALLELNITIP